MINIMPMKGGETMEPQEVFSEIVLFSDQKTMDSVGNSDCGCDTSGCDGNPCYDSGE